MKITVHRKPRRIDGRFSFWLLDGYLFCVGVENPNTEVPPGTYELRPHRSKKACLKKTDGWTVALHSPALNVYAEEELVPPDAVHRQDHRVRTVCLLHPANWADELEGCLAPGAKIADIAPNGMGVTESQRVFADLAEKLGGWEGHTLTIEEG